MLRHPYSALRMVPRSDATVIWGTDVAMLIEYEQFSAAKSMFSRELRIYNAAHAYSCEKITFVMKLTMSSSGIQLSAYICMATMIFIKAHMAAGAAD